MKQRDGANMLTSLLSRSRSALAGLGVVTLTGNIVRDVAQLWNRLKLNPLDSFLSLMAFVASMVPVMELVLKVTGRGGSGDGSEELLPVVASGARAFMTGSQPMRAVTCLLVGWSVGWTWAMIAALLTRRQHERATSIALAAAALSGVMLSAWAMTFLMDDGIRKILQFSISMTMILTTASVALAVLAAKTKFRLTYETSLAVIEKRAFALALFAAAAAALSLTMFISQLAGAR